MRYMPTFRVPVLGSLVITAGSVMNGAASSGQHFWIGIALGSDANELSLAFERLDPRTQVGRRRHRSQSTEGLRARRLRRARARALPRGRRRIRRTRIAGAVERS